MNKTFEENLTEYVEQVVLKIIKALMPKLLEEFHKPEYAEWGRWLSPKQAAQYCGFKSPKGVESLCRGRYTPSKKNDRVVRYDREALDKILSDNPIDNYLKKLS